MAEPPDKLPAASVLAFRGDEVLLVLRARGGNIGLWSAPGGHVAPGETAEQAARREFHEETGLTAGPLYALASHRVHVRPADGETSRIYDICVFVTEVPDDALPRASSDAAEARFVTPDRIAMLPTTAGLERLVAQAQDLLRNRPPIPPALPAD